MKFGLNLFSIRNKIQTEEEFLKTAEILKELGYDYLQYSGAEWNAERIKRVSEKSGLPVYLTHSPVDRILNDTEKLMEEHINKVASITSLDRLDLDALEDLLQEAIDNEDYMKAAEIRDEINRRK